MLAILFSLSIVFVTQDVDTRGLMASVANVAQNQVFDADLTLQIANDQTLKVVVGKTMQKVDKIGLLIISDPEKITSLSASNPAVLIEPMGGGLWIVTRLYQAETLYPGDTALELTVDGNLTQVPVTLSDSYFESAGMRYSLSNKGR